ncbi:hypothetical protein DFJ73DRAFT_758792 [Zopfochytrium polystomum]|nr:hypothetical protein DFJ73DRAFT_758792 [Zopfochytrium polystomum]
MTSFRVSETQTEVLFNHTVFPHQLGLKPIVSVVYFAFKPLTALGSFLVGKQRKAEESRKAESHQREAIDQDKKRKNLPQKPRQRQRQKQRQTGPRGDGAEIDAIWRLGKKDKSWKKKKKKKEKKEMSPPTHQFPTPRSPAPSPLPPSPPRRRGDAAVIPGRAGGGGGGAVCDLVEDGASVDVDPSPASTPAVPPASPALSSKFSVKAVTRRLSDFMLKNSKRRSSITSIDNCPDSPATAASGLPPSKLRLSSTTSDKNGGGDLHQGPRSRSGSLKGGLFSSIGRRNRDSPSPRPRKSAARLFGDSLFPNAESPLSNRLSSALASTASEDSIRSKQPEALSISAASEGQAELLIKEAHGVNETANKVTIDSLAEENASKNPTKARADKKSPNPANAPQTRDAASLTSGPLYSEPLFTTMPPLSPSFVVDAKPKKTLFRSFSRTFVKEGSMIDDVTDEANRQATFPRRTPILRWSSRDSLRSINSQASPAGSFSTYSNGNYVPVSSSMPKDSAGGWSRWFRRGSGKSIRSTTEADSEASTAVAAPSPEESSIELSKSVSAVVDELEQIIAREISSPQLAGNGLTAVTTSSFAASLLGGTEAVRAHEVEIEDAPTEPSSGSEVDAAPIPYLDVTSPIRPHNLEDESSAFQVYAVRPLKLWTTADVDEIGPVFVAPAVPLAPF